MDRIEINGTWYVKESDTKKEPINLDLTRFQGCTAENDIFCFEATRIACGEDEYYKGIDIKVSDKRQKPWKEEYWDNNTWMRGILEQNPESLKKLANLGGENLRFLQAFLQHLKDEDWL